MNSGARPPELGGGTDPARSLTGEVSRGGVLLFGLNAAQLVAGLAAHLAVAWFLTPREFGLFAIATGSASLILAMKDGGVRLFLARLKPAELPAHTGDAFWAGLVSSLVMGGLLVAASPLVSAVFDERDVIPVLITMALSLPAGALAQIAFAHMQVSLRFSDIARIQTASAALRYVTMVGLAAAGLGPLALAIPMVVAGLFESAFATVVARIKPWLEPFSLSGLTSMIRKTGWVIAGTVASAIYLQVDYFTLGLLVPVEILGVYYFAYQLVHRLTAPFVATIRTVLLPGFVRARQDDHGATLATSFVMLLAAPAFVWLGVVFRPLEELLWNGRWEDAVNPLLALTAVYPLFVVSTLYHTLLQAQDQFRRNALLITARAAGLVVASIVAGTISSPDRPTPIAVVIAGYLFVSVLADGIAVARFAGLSLRSLNAVLWTPYLAALAAGAVTLGIARALDVTAGVGVALTTVVLIALTVASWRLIFAGRFRQLAPVLTNIPGGRLLLRYAGTVPTT